MLTEIVSTPFIPRMALYLLVLAMGIAGLIRRRRRGPSAIPVIS